MLQSRWLPSREQKQQQLAMLVQLSLHPLLALLSVLLVIVASGCRSDCLVAAAWPSGQQTRNNFNMWWQTRNLKTG